MPKFLVIVESPNKVKKIKSFLGDDYEVTASVGHIRDLPPKKLGVDIKKKFEPTYEVYPDKKDVVKNIITKAKKADVVYLLTDLDREGEGIASHIVAILPDNTTCRRATSASITKREIQTAIQNAGDINKNLVESYECRRILDRLAGYKTSYLVRQATGGTSAGRVQSAALRLIADREKEIRVFVPEEYWPIEVELLTDKDEKIIAQIKKPKPRDIKNGEEARKICDTLKADPIKVSRYDKKEVSSRPYGPFTTSTMLQAAAAIYGWKADKTMKVAQGLYESSHISYHRTDSTFVVPEFIGQVRDVISKECGSKYLPSKPITHAAKGKAQEAHEACRITDLSVRTIPDRDKDRLYQLIWKRTVASQMANLRQEQIQVEFECEGYILGASGSRLLFDGWCKVWDFRSTDDRLLPELTVGQKVKAIDVKTEQKFTEPPPRFSNNSLIRELESRAIGRPSTYAAIIRTLDDRKYVEQSKKNIAATDLGITVSDFLIAADFCFVDLQFTADMEDKLDRIAENKLSKEEALTEFWSRLKGDIDRAKEKKAELSKTGLTCPKCQGELFKRHSRYGDFYACGNYKNKENPCKYIANIAEDGSPIEKVGPKESEHACPNCGQPLIIREGKKGEYLGCKNWKQDDCKGFYNMDATKIEFKKKKTRYKRRTKNVG